MIDKIKAWFKRKPIKGNSVTPAMLNAALTRTEYAKHVATAQGQAWPREFRKHFPVEEVKHDKGIRER